MGFLSSIEVTKEMMLASVVNARGPAFHCFGPRCSEKPATAVLSRRPFVLLVYGVGHIAKVLDAIVVAITVDVINVFFGPCLIAQCPRHSVGLHRTTSDVDPRVAVSGLMTNALKKLAGLRIVTVVAKRDLKKCGFIHPAIITQTSRAQALI